MKSVLVVEDDRAVGETIRAILEESYRVDVVTVTTARPRVTMGSRAKRMRS